MSTRSGNCWKAKSITGTEAIRATGMVGAHLIIRFWKVMKKVAVKATIMVAIEISNKMRPHMSFNGNDTRKSLSAYREVRIDRNISIEAVEVNNDMAFDMAKTTKDDLLTKTGLPVSLLLPPGSWKAAEKTTVAIRVATKAHDSAVFFIHCSPLILSPSCSSLNKV